MSNIFDPRFEPLPLNPVEYPHRLAHDLAWGIHNRKWKSQFKIEFKPDSSWNLDILVNEISLREYLNLCWRDQLPDFRLLQTYGYIERFGYDPNGIDIFEMTKKALRLPEQKLPIPIFISYSRSESSALALLLLARFKEQNMSPFLDMHPDREDLPLGSDWEAQIKIQIQNSDTIIVLVGPQTLMSKNVIKELNWARQFEKKIIPLWHRVNEPPQYSDILSQELKTITDSKQGVKVEAENPKQYNAALDQLLAHFSIAP